MFYFSLNKDFFFHVYKSLLYNYQAFFETDRHNHPDTWQLECKPWYHSKHLSIRYCQLAGIIIEFFFYYVLFFPWCELSNSICFSFVCVCWFCWYVVLILILRRNILLFLFYELYILILFKIYQQKLFGILFHHQCIKHF